MADTYLWKSQKHATCPVCGGTRYDIVELDSDLKGTRYYACSLEGRHEGCGAEWYEVQDGNTIYRTPDKQEAMRWLREIATLKTPAHAEKETS
jgi:formate dehydrogenase maturation protein FdhE